MFVQRQADVFAAAAVGGDAAEGRLGRDRMTVSGVNCFANALLAVAKLNGISPRRRNFRHGSIAARVDYVGWLLAEGLGARAFDRRIRRIKVLVWVLFALGLLSWLAPV